MALHAIPRGRVVASAHARSVELGVVDIAAALQGSLGQSLLGIIVGKDNRTVARWVHGTAHPSRASEKLLRGAFQVFELITTSDSPDVARAWFMGMNPQLDDSSPAEALADGRTKNVMAAARSYINAQDVATAIGVSPDSAGTARTHDASRN